MPSSVSVNKILQHKWTTIFGILILYIPIQTLMLVVSQNHVLLSFTAVPILIAGWLLGAKYAIAMTSALLVCNTFIKAFTLGIASYKEPLAALFPLTVFTVMGFLVGKLAELKRTVKSQLNELKKAGDQQRILQEQLNNSEKMRAIGQLAGGLAHDFNNQLSCIMGSAEMLKEEGLKLEDVSYYVDSIKAVTRRAADLTKQVLYFSRKGKTQSVLINVHSIITNVVSLLQHSIDKKIAINLRLNAEDPSVIGDPSQLESAVLNLALNARDAMPHGGELTFETETVSLDQSLRSAQPNGIAPGRYLRIAVTDTGTGIDEHIQKHLFEPFFSTKDTGRGMGLASVYGIVENHDGAIDFTTEPNHSTTFAIHLPLPQNKGALETHMELPKTLVKGQGHILLVDDDVLFLNITTQMLSSLGYETTTFTDGAQAVRYFEEHWRDTQLVVLDLVMPGIDGAEVFSAMRAVDPELKVLLSSGCSVEGVAQRLIDEGALGFLQKPFSKAELSTKIARTLKCGDTPVPQ